MSALLSVLLAVSVSQQGTEKLVSAEVRASAAPIAIAEIAKQINYPLEAMPSTSGDILIIKVKDVSIKSLMAKIATVTKAGWEQTNNGYRLLRTDAMRRQEEAEEQARLTQLVKTEMDKMNKTLQAGGAMTDQKAMQVAERLAAIHQRRNSGGSVVGGVDEWKIEEGLRQQAPANRMLQTMLPLISPQIIASVPRGRSYVYSNAPNKMQRQLPGNLQASLQTFVREQAIWAKAFKMVSSRQTDQNRIYFENMQDPGSKRIGKVLLNISRPIQGRYVYVRLVVADQKGRTMGTGQQNIGYNWDEVAARQTPAKPIDAAEESMKFSGNTKIWMDTLQEMFKSAEVNRGQPTTAANPALKDILLSPDKNEPLSFIATDSLFEVARIRKLNVVACPNDEMIIGSGPMPEGQKPTAFLNGIKTYNHDVDISDGWLLVAPKEAIGARAGRADRFALGRYIRTAYKEGRLTLDNRATFALQSGLEYENFMPMFFLSMLGVLQNGMDYGGDWDTLKLYASLTPMQRRAAVAKQPIPFQALQPLQLEIIRHIVFDSNYSRIQVNYDQEDFADAGEDGIMGDGLDREPTEILPNGFTGQEILTIIDTSEPKVFCTPDREGENYYYGEMTMDANQLAQEQFQQERPEFFPWLNQPGYRRPKYSKFRVGSQRLVQFEAKFTKKASLNLDVRDNQYQGQYVTADKLPEDIKKKIQDALANLREQYKNQKPPVYNNGDGGTTTIPPAPRPRK